MSGLAEYLSLSVHIVPYTILFKAYITQTKGMMGTCWLKGRVSGAVYAIGAFSHRLMRKRTTNLKITLTLILSPICNTMTLILTLMATLSTLPKLQYVNAHLFLANSNPHFNLHLTKFTAIPSYIGIRYYNIDRPR